SQLRSAWAVAGAGRFVNTYPVAGGGQDFNADRNLLFLAFSVADFQQSGFGGIFIRFLGDQFGDKIASFAFALGWRQGRGARFGFWLRKGGKEGEQQDREG